GGHRMDIRLGHHFRGRIEPSLHGVFDRPDRHRNGLPDPGAHALSQGIWAGVFKYVAAPINTACLGAAGAFFVSVFTDFRGAAELGIIASGGLLLCLLTAHTVLPPMLTLWPAAVGPVERAPFDPP